MGRRIQNVRIMLRDIDWDFILIVILSILIAIESFSLGMLFSSVFFGGFSISLLAIMTIAVFLEIFTIILIITDRCD